jgi:catechol 2,3-dioxygenase-like lactoylglutathione lyase family enzyme
MGLAPRGCRGADTSCREMRRLVESTAAMEQRISIVTLGVADLARSRTFYESLGWRASQASSAAVVFFQAGGMILALYPRADLAKDASVAGEGQGFPGFSISYNARTRSEVDAVLAEAEVAGAKILKPAQEAFWGGYSGVLRRSGQLCVGGRLEPIVPDYRGWEYPSAGVRQPVACSS